jgi:hypothetical protein
MIINDQNESKIKNQNEKEVFWSTSDEVASAVDAWCGMWHVDRHNTLFLFMGARPRARARVDERDFFAQRERDASSPRKVKGIRRGMGMGMGRHMGQWKCA